VLEASVPIQVASAYRGVIAPGHVAREVTTATLGVLDALVQLENVLSFSYMRTAVDVTREALPPTIGVVLTTVCMKANRLLRNMVAIGSFAREIPATIFGVKNTLVPAEICTSSRRVEAIGDVAMDGPILMQRLLVRLEIASRRRCVGAVHTVAPELTFINLRMLKLAVYLGCP